MPWPRPRVFWCSNYDGRDLRRPNLLISSARLSDFARWREQNKWADALPFVLLAEPDDATQLTRAQPSMSSVAFGPARAGVPSVVLNAPTSVRNALSALGDMPPELFGRPDLNADQLAFLRYEQAIAILSADLGPPPWWWIMADVDDGAGAIVIAAMTFNACVALAAKPMGALGAARASTYDVDVSVHDVLPVVH